MVRKYPAKKSDPGAAGPRSGGRLQRAIDETVKREITSALKEVGGNVTRAASILGITRDSLIKRLRSLGVQAAAFKR